MIYGNVLEVTAEILNGILIKILQIICIKQRKLKNDIAFIRVLEYNIY